MSDTQINQFVASGTTAERTAFTPTPPTPASGPDNGYTFFDTDDSTLYCWDGAAWQPAITAGAGTVTNTGTLTANQLILGNGGVDVTALGSLGTTTTVLHGNAAGAPTFGAVSLTADVSGTLPIASGGTGQTAQTAAFDALAPTTTAGDVIYHNGTDNVRLGIGTAGQVLTVNAGATAPEWAASSGGSGGLVLLESHTASSSASLEFTSWYSSDYDVYTIEIVDLVPASSPVDLLMTVSTDGGSTYLASTNYRFYNSKVAADGATGAYRSDGGASISLAHIDVDTWVNSSGASLSATLKFYKPGSTSLHKHIMGSSLMEYSTGTLVGYTVFAQINNASAINAFKFAASSGNIASGTIRVYGIAKS